MTNTNLTDTQKVQNGEQIIISGRKFTVEMFPDLDTVFLVGVRGGQFFLRGFLRDPGYFQVVPSNTGMGEPIRNKSSERLTVFIVGNTLTDMTGVKRVK
jgi:hypothetical protein